MMSQETEIDGHPTTILLDECKQYSEKKSTRFGNKEWWTLNQLPDLRQFTDPKPPEKKANRVPWGTLLNKGVYSKSSSQP